MAEGKMIIVMFVVLRAASLKAESMQICIFSHIFFSGTQAPPIGER